VQQTKLASSPVKFWAHNTIVRIDWLFDCFQVFCKSILCRKGLFIRRPHTVHWRVHSTGLIRIQLQMLSSKRRQEVAAITVEVRRINGVLSTTPVRLCQREIPRLRKSKRT